MVDPSEKVGEDAEGCDTLLEVVHLLLDSEVWIPDEILELLVTLCEHGDLDSFLVRLVDFHVVADLHDGWDDHSVVHSTLYHHLVQDSDQVQSLVVVVCFLGNIDHELDAVLGVVVHHLVFVHLASFSDILRVGDFQSLDWQARRGRDVHGEELWVDGEILEHVLGTASHDHEVVDELHDLHFLVNVLPKQRGHAQNFVDEEGERHSFLCHLGQGLDGPEQLLSELA